ncbi:MAG TPA: heparinase II/III-family protein, partial [Gemmatimonadaceae bacterium]|nr:heparinase II/III-family protein [Gemmatimonadaceae bacterium]
HRYTTEVYTHLVLLAEANGLPLAPHVRPTLARLYEHLLHLARPDGTIPLLGDDDGGRLVQLDGGRPHEVRGLLAIGAAVLDRPELAHAAGDDLAALGWLLGADGLRRFDALDPRPPAATSRAFPDGGLYVFRDGWTRDARWGVIDCGPHGAMNCGHAHADALALEIAAGGRPLLVDAGTYTYPGPERNAFRASAAHNTVTLDGRSSSEPATPFQWRRIATCRTEAWHADASVDYFAGAHGGFGDPADPAPHRREVLFVRDGYWVVRDQVAARGRHEVCLHWRCAPGLQARLTAADTWDVADAHGTLALRIGVITDGGEATVEHDWVSPIYGRREPADLCILRRQGEGAQELVTMLLPAIQGRVAPTRALAVAGGRGVAVARASGEDWVLLGDGGALTCDDVRTDARWLWLRRDGSGRVVEWAAVGAVRAAVGEDELLAAGERRPWTAGRPPAVVNPEMGVG